MKKFFVLMGYLAGFVVWAKYAKKAVKTPGKWKKGAKEQALDVGKNFIESHKHAFSDLKKEYWTEENKKLVLSKKKDLEKFFELAKEEFAEAQKVLKKHGLDTEAIGGHIESIHEEHKGLIEKLGSSPTAKAAKRKLSDIVRKIKKSI